VHRIEAQIKAIPDFPEPGVTFRDLTPLLQDPAAMRLVVHQLVHPFLGTGISAVAGIEARGFVFGALAAAEMGVGFVPLRKPGKLPREIHRAEYQLEYGSNCLEIHVDALDQSDNVLLVDDLIATGGTAAASCNLIERCCARIAACAFVVELQALNGRAALGDRPIHTLVQY
jgi:adenine phosphoribosyltransferase